MNIGRDVAAVRVEARDESHKYRIGQRVSFSQGGNGARFTVTRLMPPSGKVISYRIKSDIETYERAADESQIAPLFD